MDYIGKICPYCQTELKEGDDIVICSVCEMPHHKACWIENKACTTFGCTGTMMNTDHEPITMEEEEILCPQCGGKLKASHLFCTFCGAPVKKTSNEPHFHSSEDSGHLRDRNNPNNTYVSSSQGYGQPKKSLLDKLINGTGMPQNNGMAYNGGIQNPGMTYNGGMQNPGMTYNGGMQNPGMTYNGGMQNPGMTCNGGMQNPGMTYNGGMQNPGMVQETEKQPSDSEASAGGAAEHSIVSQPNIHQNFDGTAQNNPQFNENHNSNGNRNQQFGGSFNSGFQGTQKDSDFFEFVQSNQQVYANAFQKIQVTNSMITWNWCSFLFGGFWFAFRKMYNVALAFIGIAFIAGLIPILGLFLQIGLWVCSGLFGNFFYKKYVDENLLMLKQMDMYNRPAFLLKKGGTSIAAVFVMIGISLLLWLILGTLFAQLFLY